MARSASTALGLADLIRPRITCVELPEGKIYIRALSAAYAVGLRGRTLLDADIFDLLAHSICDANGQEIMTAEQVGEIPLPMLQPILDQVMAFNALADGNAAADLKKTRRSDSPTS
jgi:hypothetical protein